MLDLKIDSFCLPTTEITAEDNLPFQVEEIVLDNTEQCQLNTYFITNLLDDITKKLPLATSDDATNITTCHTNKMSTIAQQFTSDDTLIPIPNIHTPITEITTRLYLSLALMRILKNQNSNLRVK